MRRTYRYVSARCMRLVALTVMCLTALASWAQRGGDQAGDVVTLNIENATAAYLLQHSVSTFERGSASGLDDREFRSLRASALDNGYRNDQPRVLDISFDARRRRDVRVVVALDRGYQSLVLDTVVAQEAVDGHFRMGNFVPGQTYYYKVTSRRRTLTEGAVKAEGQLRMIGIDSGWNIRDLGGWTGWGGNRVRYEQVYRGGSPGGKDMNSNEYRLTDADIAELHRIGIRAHLDLRALPGRGVWNRDPKLNAYSLGFTPMQEADYLNTATDYALHDALHFSAAVGNVAWIIHELKAGHPVYFHCRTGADRTGVMGFTLLGLLGCDAYHTPNGANQIAIDYELTSLGMDEEGTIEYNTTGKHPTNYSNRYANGIATSGYDYFRTLRSLKADDLTLDNFQLQCYYYLNRYFRDHPVATAGEVYINKADLDWFVNFMLGITDREGHLQPGHTTLFTGPEWAVDDAGNTLEQAYTTANRLQYK